MARTSDHFAATRSGRRKLFSSFLTAFLRFTRALSALGIAVISSSAPIEGLENGGGFEPPFPAMLRELDAKAQM